MLVVFGILHLLTAGTAKHVAVFSCVISFETQVAMN
jgi:hypothetical protein